MNKLIFSLIVGVVVSIVVSLFLNFGVFEGWQLRLNDAFYTEKIPLDQVLILKIDDKSLQTIGRWPWDREVFIDLLNKLNDSKAIGFDIAFFESYDKTTDRELAKVMSKLPIVIPSEFTKYQTDNGVIIGTELLEPIEEYNNITNGFVNIFSDFDGITRSLPLNIGGLKSKKSFSLLVAEKYRGKELNSNEIKSGNELLINFGNPNSFNSISIIDFINSPDNTLIDTKSKIVLIGATSPDLHDEYFVPTSNGKAMSGVEINANAIQTILTKNFLEKQSLFSSFMLIFILAILTAIIISFLDLKYSIPVTILLIIVCFFVTVFYFERGIILNILYPIMSIILVSSISLLLNYGMERKEKKLIRELFSKYVSKDVADEIIKNHEKIHLEGEEKKIVIMFADIRGFTSMSEKMRPIEVVRMLNTYLGEMTDVIFEYKGTLDKYIGDCAMAMFGAPVKLDDPLMASVKAALDIQKRMNDIRTTKDVPHVDVGIGLNYGFAVVGNIGSKVRLNYTAIGDSVNTASRMCSNATKDQIIVPEDFYNMVKDKVEAEKIGEIKVKGKEKPIVIYNIVGLK